MPSSSQSSSRPLLFGSIYALISAVAFYYMRLGPTGQLTGKYLEPLMANAISGFTYPGRKEVIRQVYTGIHAVDGLLSMLVSAFLAGPAGWSRHIQLQQINFLLSWTSVLVVWSVESARTKNRWALIAL